MTTDLKLNTIQGVTAMVNRIAEAMLVNKEQTPTNMGTALDAVITMIEKRGTAEIKAAMVKVREATQLPAKTDKPTKSKESLV
jgi:hypothetical protein